jgi:hypothetical protein
MEKRFSQVEKKIEEIMWAFKPLDYRYSYNAIFKLKRNDEKLIDG